MTFWSLASDLPPRHLCFQTVLLSRKYLFCVCWMFTLLQSPKSATKGFYSWHKQLLCSPAFSVFACQLSHETHFPIVSHGTPWNARQVKYLCTFLLQPFLCNKGSKVLNELIEHEAKGDPCCFMLERKLLHSSKQISAKTLFLCFYNVHWGKAGSMHCPQGLL